MDIWKPTNEIWLPGQNHARYRNEEVDRQKRQAVERVVNMALNTIPPANEEEKLLKEVLIHESDENIFFALIDAKKDEYGNGEELARRKAKTWIKVNGIMIILSPYIPRGKALIKYRDGSIGAIVIYPPIPEYIRLSLLIKAG